MKVSTPSVFLIKVTFGKFYLKLCQMNWIVAKSNVNGVVDELPSQKTIYTCLTINIWTRRCWHASTWFYALRGHPSKWWHQKWNRHQKFFTLLWTPLACRKCLEIAMQHTHFRAKSVKNDLKPTGFLNRNSHFEMEGVSILFRWCLLMLKIDILFILSIKDCMFITFTSGNIEGCYTAKFDSNGHTHTLEEAWLLVFGRSSKPFLSIGSSFEFKPNGFLYSVPNPPTRPCCILHQQFSLLPIVRIP